MKVTEAARKALEHRRKRRDMGTLDKILERLDSIERHLRMNNHYSPPVFYDAKWNKEQVEQTKRIKEDRECWSIFDPVHDYNNLTGKYP